jgi:hypothetical protein
MAASDLEYILELANKRKPSKGASLDGKAQAYPSPEKPPEGTNLSPDDNVNADTDLPPGADQGEWQDNEDMHNMGITVGPAGTVSHGAMKIGHVVTVPGKNTKNRYVGIHHPSGAQTDAHPNRARAAMSLMGYHTYMPRKAGDGTKVAMTNVEAVLALAAKPGKTPVKPYGNVPYADPGYQADKKKRYPLDSSEHVHAALGYINQKDNAAKYSPENLAKVRAKIYAAAKKLGIETSDSK